MLQFLPLEILEEILHHLLYPVNYQGYYLDITDHNQWTQQDALNLSAACRLLRHSIAPRLWQHINLDFRAVNKFKLPNGYRLFSDAAPPESKRAISFLNCSWIEKKQNLGRYVEKFGDADRYMSTILEYHSSMDSVFKYVKVFKLISGANEIGSATSKGLKEYLNRYKLALSLVNPHTMPALEDFIFDIFLVDSIDEIHTDLGRVLRTFKSKIKLSLSMQSLLCHFHYDDELYFLDLIRPFGLLPFVVNLQTPTTDCGSLARSQLIDLRGLEFDQLPDFDFGADSELPSFPYITSAYDSSITYLDVSYIPVDTSPPRISWIPPTVKVLKCNNKFLLPFQDENYQIYEKLSSLTLRCTENFNHFPGNLKFYFNNLTELQILRGGNLLMEGIAPHYFDVLRSVLTSNKQTLVRLKIEHVFRHELEILLPHMDMLETLEYGLVLMESDNDTNTEFISNTMSKWGPHLRQLNYQIRHFPDLERNTPELAHIDYAELRLQVLEHPNLQFNAVQFLVLGHSVLPTGNQLFGSTFQDSRDSKYFDFTDFCELPDKKLFNNQFHNISGQSLISTNIFMDFFKLRELINKVELEEPSLAIE